MYFLFWNNKNSEVPPWQLHQQCKNKSLKRERLCWIMELDPRWMWCVLLIASNTWLRNCNLLPNVLLILNTQKRIVQNKRHNQLLYTIYGWNLHNIKKNTNQCNVIPHIEYAHKRMWVEEKQYQLINLAEREETKEVCLKQLILDSKDGCMITKISWQMWHGK